MSRFKGSLYSTDFEFTTYASTDFAYTKFTATDFLVLTADSYAFSAYNEFASITDSLYLDVSKFFNDSSIVDDSVDIEIIKDIIDPVSAMDTLTKEVVKEGIEDFSVVSDSVELFLTKGFFDSFAISDSIAIEATKNIVDVLAITDTLLVDQVTYDDYIDNASIVDTISKDVRKDFDLDSISVSDDVLFIPVVIVNNTFNGSKVGRSVFG